MKNESCTSSAFVAIPTGVTSAIVPLSNPKEVNVPLDDANGATTSMGPETPTSATCAASAAGTAIIERTFDTPGGRPMRMLGLGVTETPNSGPGRTCDTATED